MEPQDSVEHSLRTTGLEKEKPVRTISIESSVKAIAVLLCTGKMVRTSHASQKRRASNEFVCRCYFPIFLHLTNGRNLSLNSFITCILNTTGRILDEQDVERLSFDYDTLNPPIRLK
ncbi:hypothetical protein TNCV_4341381 [Trichonephila clavipes]|nr:hypothetical protein TNCV_4341381 [Trichonephila clavipes]